MFILTMVAVAEFKKIESRWDPGAQHPDQQGPGRARFSKYFYKLRHVYLFPSLLVIFLLKL